MAFPAIRTYIIPHPPVQNAGVTPKSVSDSGVGTDAVSILVTTTIADTGNGTDTLSLLAQVPMADTGIGADALSILAQINLQEGYWGDNFDDNSIDTSKWSNWGSSQVLEQNGRLELSSTLASGYYGMDSLKHFDLTGHYFSCKLVNAGNQSITSWAIYFQLAVDSNNALYISVEGGNLVARKKVAGVQTALGTVTYNTTTMKYLRIREASGTIYFEYTADKITWTAFATLTSTYPFSITNLVVDPLVGTWQAESSITTGIFDEFESDTLYPNAVDAIAILAILSLADSGVGSDLIAILATIILNDTGLANEALSILVAIVLSDLGSAVDAISLLVALAITDSGSGIDIVSVIAALAVNDTGIGADALAILSLIVLADSGNATDAFSILVQLSLSDAAIGIDAASLLAIISQADSGIGSDAISLAALITQSETGLGNESINIQAQVPIIDSGVGTDQATIQSSVPTNDSGQGTDTVSVIAAIPLSDSGQGSENVSIFTQINLADFGIGTDSIIVLLKILLADNGKAVETLALYKNVRETFVSAGKLFTRLGGGLFVKDH